MRPWSLGKAPGVHDDHGTVRVPRRDGRIHLVVVMRPGHTGPDQMIELKLVGNDLVRWDHELLGRCERRIGEWGHDVTVTTEVIHGQVVPSLVAAVADADLLVLGHHRMSRRTTCRPTR